MYMYIRKLKKTVWIVKKPEVVIRPLNLTGNFKICMDYIMFHKFTVDNTRKVYDILDEKETYQRKKKCLLEYIRPF